MLDITNTTKGAFMRVLFLCPKLESHQSSLGGDINVMRMASGNPRRRRGQVGAADKATVSFTLRANDYEYIMAFWRVTRAEVFACRAVTKQAEMRWYASRWVGAPTIINLGAGAFSFSCELSVGNVVRLAIIKYASHPYPVLIDEDAYQPSVKPLDIELIQILKEGFGEDAYQPSVKPLDITLRNLLRRRDIDDNDAYQPSVKPLDITLRNLLRRRDIDDNDAYIPSVKPLDITLKRVLIEHNVNDNDAYIPSVKPLDITLKKGV